MSALTALLELAKVKGFGDASSGVSYSGDDPNDAFSLEYYRSKVTEFQQTLNGLDLTATLLYDLLDYVPDGPERLKLVGSLDEFYQKRGEFRTTAEGMNALAAVINSAGGRWPVLSIPSTLQGFGALPAVPLAAIAAVVAVIAGLITWAVAWASTVNTQTDRLFDAIGNLPPEQQAAAIDKVQQVQQASASVASPLSDIASIAKWIAIGAAVWFGYQAFTTYQASRS